jgi:hypothetical protein
MSEDGVYSIVVTASPATGAAIRSCWLLLRHTALRYTGHHVF